MSETPIHAEDGSPLRAEPKMERPFTHPMEAYQTQSVDNDGEDAPESEGEVAEDPRMAIMNAAAEAADQDRMIAPGTRQEDMPMGEPVPEPGLDSQEAFSGEEEQEAPHEEVDTDVDPLEDFIVRNEEGDFFRTVVDGREQLIPLERARAQLQKHEAADQRMQVAAQINKNLEEREAAIAARERQFAVPKEPDPVPEIEERITDEELESKARDLVNGLFTGSEEEAAAKLAEVLKEVKGAAQPATQINADELIQRAVSATTQVLSEKERSTDIREGYVRFEQDYPEIVQDSMLLNMADGMTDAIAQEHPEWKPSQVMQEAGKRVREWVDQVSGKEPAPEQSEAPQVDRQDRKRKLRPMPTARQGVEEQEPQDQPETPQSFMDEIRKSRGQAV